MYNIAILLLVSFSLFHCRLVPTYIWGKGSYSIFKTLGPKMDATEIGSIEEFMNVVHSVFCKFQAVDLDMERLWLHL